MSFAANGDRTFYRRHGKRILDLFGGFLLALPAFLMIAACCAAIRLETKGAAFFIQTRPGYHGQLFRLFKLRTMLAETRRDGGELTDRERVTKVGKFIRTHGLDELPQILNILRGEMSFIGPRPLLAQYLPLYTPEQQRRHDVLPGISGWAQVNGQNEISWEQKFERDVWYVKNLSFRLDMKIIGMTVVHMLNKQGNQTGTDGTLHVFQGGEGS